jgi:hypothetical protein
MKPTMKQKRPEMKKEHTLAVLEPTLDGDSTLEFAKETVARGGDASIVVLLGRETEANIAAFANAEGLTFADGREIYLERLSAMYTDLFGDRVSFVIEGRHVERDIFAEAIRGNATSVIVPQRLVGYRHWKSAVSKSQVPVLLAPPKAA